MSHKDINWMNRRCGSGAADYIQKAALKKWVFSLDLKVTRESEVRMSCGSLFQTASDALVKVRSPAVELSPVGIESRRWVSDLGCKAYIPTEDQRDNKAASSQELCMWAVLSCSQCVVWQEASADPWVLELYDPAYMYHKQHERGSFVLVAAF